MTATLNSDSADAVMLTQQRINAANSAAYEIELTVQAMRMVIDDKDAGGEIHPLARGMVARIVALTSAICQALDPDHEDQASVANTVYVSNAAKLANRS